MRCSWRQRPCSCWGADMGLVVWGSDLPPCQQHGMWQPQKHFSPLPCSQLQAARGHQAHCQHSKPRHHPAGPADRELALQLHHEGGGSAEPIDYSCRSHLQCGRESPRQGPAALWRQPGVQMEMAATFMACSAGPFEGIIKTVCQKRVAHLMLNLPLLLTLSGCCAGEADGAAGVQAQRLLWPPHSC